MLRAFVSKAMAMLLSLVPITLPNSSLNPVKLTPHQMLSSGIWATLNFQWVSRQYPLAVLAMERVLMAAVFPAAATLQSWGLVGLVGAAQVPYYQLVLLGGLFHALLLPLPPSVQPQVPPGGHVPSWQKSARIMGELWSHLRQALPAPA